MRREYGRSEQRLLEMAHKRGTQRFAIPV
jgi:hypothetical protein